MHIRIAQRCKEPLAGTNLLSASRNGCTNVKCCAQYHVMTASDPHRRSVFPALLLIALLRWRAASCTLQSHRDLHSHTDPSYLHVNSVCTWLKHSGCRVSAYVIKLAPLMGAATTAECMIGGPWLRTCQVSMLLCTSTCS